MDVVEQTNDPVTLSAYQAVLRQAGIESWILDHHTSILEGSLGVLPHRLMVDDQDGPRARRVLEDYRRDLADGRLESIERPTPHDDGEWSNG